MVYPDRPGLVVRNRRPAARFLEWIDWFQSLPLFFQAILLTLPLSAFAAYFLIIHGGSWRDWPWLTNLFATYGVAIIICVALIIYLGKQAYPLMLSAWREVRRDRLMTQALVLPIPASVGLAFLYILMGKVRVSNWLAISLHFYVAIISFLLLWLLSAGLGHRRFPGNPMLGRAVPLCTVFTVLPHFFDLFERQLTIIANRESYGRGFWCSIYTTSSCINHNAGPTVWSVNACSALFDLCAQFVISVGKTGGLFLAGFLESYISPMPWWLQIPAYAGLTVITLALCFLLAVLLIWAVFGIELAIATPLFRFAFRQGGGGGRGPPRPPHDGPRPPVQRAVENRGVFNRFGLNHELIRRRAVL